jgi:hypothetical protein
MARTVFTRSNTGVVGSNPTRGIDVSVRLFCVCVVLCVGSGLATGLSPVRGVLPAVCRLRNWKSWKGPAKGYRSREKKERILTLARVSMAWSDQYIPTLDMTNVFVVRKLNREYRLLAKGVTFMATALLICKGICTFNSKSLSTSSSGSWCTLRETVKVKWYSNLP